MFSFDEQLYLLHGLCELTTSNVRVSGLTDNVYAVVCEFDFIVGAVCSENLLALQCCASMPKPNFVTFCHSCSFSIFSCASFFECWFVHLGQVSNE